MTTPARDVARLFLRLGVVGFGGPAAHIAMMRDEVVRRREWIDDREFLDLVAACSVIPGPNSTELAIHLGRRRAGWRGFAAAGAGFILPAVVIVLVLAWVYERYGTTPTGLDLSTGILPVVVAVIAHAVAALAPTATGRLRDPLLVVVAIGAAAAWSAGVAEFPVLVVAALAGATAGGLGARPGTAFGSPLLVLAADVDRWRLGWSFLRIGSLLFGSGYVLVGFVESEFVERLGWLTERQLLDAVAVGQVTPGPVFTMATFVGFQIAGLTGALIATLAIFAPAFAFVAVLDPLVTRVRRSPAASRGLDTVIAASVGLMAAALVRLADVALVDVVTWATALVALVALARWRTNIALLVAAGALIGLLQGR